MTVDKFGRHIHSTEKKLDNVKKIIKIQAVKEVSKLNGLINISINGKSDKTTDTYYTLQNLRYTYNIPIDKGRIVDFTFYPENLTLVVDGEQYDSTNITDLVLQSKSVLAIPKHHQIAKNNVYVDLYIKYPLLQND